MKCTIFTILLFYAAVIQSKKPFSNIIVSNTKEDSLNGLIRNIVANSMEKRCLVVVCDQIYYKILDWDFLSKFDYYLSYFIVVVEESEDLLAPAHKIQRVLKNTKAQGCNLYIVLISNAVQSSRLLKYGEKYRTINTRARFLILHDYRLFQANLHYLWQKIVNVIFIRELVGKKGSQNESEIWYELSTVPFPYPIKSVMVLRRLTIWKHSKLDAAVELFKDRAVDLKNQTLRTTVVAHLPASIKTNISDHESVRAVMSTHFKAFQGIEIEILQTLAVAMNFLPEIYEPREVDNELWGEQRPDGKYTGLLGEMVKDRADIALGDLQYTRYFLQLMDLSVPYNTECLTFLTPESLTNNSWKTLVLPFKFQLWLAILFSWVLMAFFFYTLCKFHDKMNKVKFKDLQEKKRSLQKELESVPKVKVGQKLNSDQMYSLLRKKYLLPKVEGEPVGLYIFRRLGNSLLYTYGMLLVISLPKLPTGWSIRVLTGWYWMYCILIVVAYKASMTAILANPAPRIVIDTLEQLINSQLEIGGWGEVNIDFFRTAPDAVSQIIGSKFKKINDSEEAIDSIAMGTLALYENEYYLKRALVKKQLKYQKEEDTLKGNESTQIQAIPKGDHYLHIMNECMINMPISIGLKKNSPLKFRIDTLIRRLVEVGLVKKWLNDVMRQTANEEVHYGGSEAVKAVMNMQKFMGALIALFIGYLVSFIVLISEIAYFEVNIKKHPNFNKYTKQVTKNK